MKNLENKFKLANILDSDEVNVFKSPVIAAIVLVYLTTVFVQNTYKVSMLSMIWFTIAMIIHLLVYFSSHRIFKHNHWLYFAIQGIIIFSCAVIVPEEYETIFLGLIPVLLVQSRVIYRRVIKIIITFIYFYGIFCGTIIVLNGVDELIRYIPILLIITLTVMIYSSIYIRQVNLRIRAQKLTQELEHAYEKVEELTLTNERQRVARDLHDTLSQGLAGLIMQLDAINTNLNNNNTKRAKEIVQKSMQHARRTLSDSRYVIHDLRFEKTENMDLTEAIKAEITKFNATSNTLIITNISIKSQVSARVFKHIVYIVREGLNNIGNHAKARNVVVEVIEEHNRINITITDDGVGFDVKLLSRLFGHYGILGMTERVKALDGEIRIKSKKRMGTKLNITIPIGKGIDDNE